MGHLLTTYTVDGEPHRIELVELRDGALVLDRPGTGAPLVVAELCRGEGEDQARAVLHAGGYLKRATGGEAALCRALAADEGLGRAARARAA
jgi:hypothetical protein